MSGLYLSGWRARGARRAWDRCSVGLASAGTVLRGAGALALWGEPVDAVAWFAGDTGGLRILVADYANGCRVTYRRTLLGCATLQTERRNAR